MACRIFKSSNLNRLINIDGPLSTDLGQLEMLVDPELSWSSLTGTLPTPWRRLANLKSLDVHASLQIIGTVPSEYGILTSLKYMEIWGITLSGTVGPEVCALGEFGSFIADCRLPIAGAIN